MTPARALDATAALIAAVAALWLCAAPAAGAGGPVIPGGAYGANGVTGPNGQPGADHRYVTIDTDDGGTIVERIATEGGVVESVKRLGDRWALPAVTITGDAGGLSADGETLVLIKPGYSPRTDQTHLLVLDTRRQVKVREEIELDGRFSFDAISPDGRLAYLVEYRDPRFPLEYRVRAYDLSTERFEPGEIVDPEEPDERMAGQPVARRASPDGRWAYTLYGGGEETFIHALDTKAATAVCIDLTQFGPRAMYLLGLKVDSDTGAITVLKSGDPAAIVDPETFEVETPPTDSPGSDVGGATGEGGTPDGISPAVWAIAGCSVFLAGATVMLVRRRRRGNGSSSQDLDRLAGIDPANADEDRSRELVR